MPWQDGRTERGGGRGYDKECRGARDARVGLRRSVSPPHLPTAGGTAAPSGPALTWEGDRQPAWSPRVTISATCSESVTKGGFTPRVSVGPPRALGGGCVVLCTCSSMPSGTVGRRSISSVPSALLASGCSAPWQLCLHRVWVFLFTEQGWFLGVALTTCWLGRLDSSLSSCQPITSCSTRPAWDAFQAWTLGWPMESPRRISAVLKALLAVQTSCEACHVATGIGGKSLLSVIGPHPC